MQLCEPIDTLSFVSPTHPTPWLAASPREAFAALDAYEKFWGQKIETVGPLDVAELRRTWKFAARTEVRRRLREHKESVITLVAPEKIKAPERKSKAPRFGASVGGQMMIFILLRLHSPDHRAVQSGLWTMRRGTDITSHETLT